MTTREFLNGVISVCALFGDQPADCVNIEELSTKASDLLTALDAKNAKAKARPRKADPAVEERKSVVSYFVLNHVGEEFTADEVAEQTGLTAPQVASAMRIYVAGGRVTKGVRKIDSKHSKVTYIIGE